MNRTNRKEILLITAALSALLLTGCGKTVLTQAAAADTSAQSGSADTTAASPNTTTAPITITSTRSSSTAAQPQPSASKNKDDENIFQNILQNITQFYNTDDKVSVFLKDMKSPEGGKPARYTIMDMDGDGVPELVIEYTFTETFSDGFASTYPVGSEVLRIQNGKVVSFHFGYRSLETLTLKTDGTFSVSGGAADWGYDKLRFSQNACQPEDIAHCESNGYNSTGTLIVSYFVGKKSVPKADWETFCNAQDAKEDAIWHKLTA